MNEIAIDLRWQVCELSWEPGRNQVWESLCALGNGYLGVRGHPDEIFEAGPSLSGTYVAGVYAPDADGIPELVNIPDIFSAQILLGGRHMRLKPGRVSEYVRQLDMRTGVLRRSLVYTQNGRSTQVAWERFVSLANVHLAGQQVSILPLDWSGRVEVRFLLDAGVRNRSKRHLRLLHARRMGKERAIVAVKTQGSEVRIGAAFCSHAWVHQTAPPAPKEIGGPQRIGVRYLTGLECGQRATFDRLIAVHTSRDPNARSVERQCLSAIRKSAGRTYGTVLRSHRQAWQREWQKRDLEIVGPEEDQQAVRFAIFQLTQAAARSDPTVSVGAKALTGEAYRGHVFWDTEIFMLPFFTYAAPQTARQLLEYRWRTLPGAREKARQAGYSGAMFAWESADTGEETCPLSVPDPKTGEPVPVWCGRIEQHISADVVYGAYQYWLATADEKFYEDIFAELAIETARFWASRAVWNEARHQYEIHDVIGPDEYHEHVDNNVFTNYMAAWNLRVGAESLRRLLDGRGKTPLALCRHLKARIEEAENWETISRQLCIAFLPQRNLYEQHEGFLQLQQADAQQLSVRCSADPEKVRMPIIWASQVLKQADVIMLMMLWPERFTREVKQANWRHYEPRTTHDSSLSASAHAIVAADLGLRGKAYEYFRKSAFTDLHDLMGNTEDGLHAAALGGTWQAVVHGLVGMRSAGEELRCRPILPRCWRKVRFKVHHRGQAYSIEADANSVQVRAVHK